VALGDDQIARPAGHPDALAEAYAEAEVGGVPSAPRPVRRAQPAPNGRLDALASQLRGSKARVTVSGFAKAGEAPARGLDRANVVRNRLVELGVAPDRVVVDGRGHQPGKNAGVELKLAREPAAADPTDDGQPVGESHFESRTPMTIARGTSAMVAVTDEETPGEVVYLYDPDSQRGDARYAFRSVRFRNPTGSTLEAGPVTVYGNARFIGEGLTDSIPPEATTVIPFALDRQVIVTRERETQDAVARLLTVRRGVFTAEVRHTRSTKFRVVNRQHEATTVFLRHNLPAGWKLGDAPEAFERRGESYLFAVELGPEQTQEVTVSAWTPLTKTVDLRSAIGVELMRRYLETRPGDAAFADALGAVLGIHDSMAEHHAQIESLRARMGEYRDRAAELTEQIERLDLTRSGKTLRRHLERKLTDISERVQQATIAVVSNQEELMLARIRFQDAAAELTLGPKAVADRG